MGLSVWERAVNMNDKPKICEVCQKPWEFSLRVSYNKDGTKTCEHDNSDIGSSKIEKRRKENILASSNARRQAAEYASGLPQEEMVTIPSPKGDTGKRPEVVPKKVLDSITEKLSI